MKKVSTSFDFKHMVRRISTNS